MALLFLFLLSVLSAIGSLGIADLLGFYRESALFTFGIVGGMILPALFILGDPDLRRKL